jgi:hypothetical protein
MPILGKLAIAAALEFCALGVAGQDLAPRAYVITPLNSNAITLTCSYYTVFSSMARCPLPVPPLS